MLVTSDLAQRIDLVFEFDVTIEDWTVPESRTGIVVSRDACEAVRTTYYLKIAEDADGWRRELFMLRNHLWRFRAGTSARTAAARGGSSETSTLRSACSFVKTGGFGSVL